MSKEGDRPNKYSGYVYDAVWLYALALDRLMKQDKMMLQDLHSEKTVNEFVKIIRQLDFVGVSGRINFIEGNSRLSETKIIQLHVTKEVVKGTRMIPSKLVENQIGLYVPEYPNIPASLTWFDERIQWKTEDGEKPTDEEEGSCGVLTPLSLLLNLHCHLTITITVITAFALVLGALMGLLVGLKMRYEKAMRDQEDRMRALGLLTPLTVLALDDWEMPRDRVVINRKLGEGAFGLVYGGLLRGPRLGGRRRQDSQDGQQRGGEDRLPERGGHHEEVRPQEHREVAGGLHQERASLHCDGVHAVRVGPRRHLTVERLL